MILWLKLAWIWTKFCRYREDNILFCFLLVLVVLFSFLDKGVFYPGLFSNLLNLSMLWVENNCRTNSLCKLFCDQICKLIMVFKWNIFPASLREEKVHPVPILQFLSHHSTKWVKLLSQWNLMYTSKASAPSEHLFSSHKH